MARIKGIDLPNEKRIEIALTYIYGIGRNLSKQILTAAKLFFFCAGMEKFHPCFMQSHNKQLNPVQLTKF